MSNESIEGMFNDEIVHTIVKARDAGMQYMIIIKHPIQTGEGAGFGVRILSFHDTNAAGMLLMGKIDTPKSLADLRRTLPGAEFQLIDLRASKLEPSHNERVAHEIMREIAREDEARSK